MTTPTNPFVDALSAALIKQKAGMKSVSIAAEGAKSLGFLDSGNYALNWCMSNRFVGGGWSLGNTSEVYGDPSTGKSYLIARAIANALKGGVALLDDTEHAFNPDWARDALGVNTAKLALRESNTVEHHMEAIIAFMTAFEDLSKQYTIGASCLALDSLALLTTKHELEVGLSKPTMTRAKEIKALFRITAHRMSQFPVAYLIANHTIDNIGDFFNAKDTPGGGGTKFQASTRVALYKSSKMKAGAEKGAPIIGVKVIAKVEKSRKAPPFRQCQMVIPFYESISPYSGLVELLLRIGVLTITKNTLVLRGQDTGLPAHKSSFMLQDKSGEALVVKYPTLLAELDATPKLGSVAVGAVGVEDGPDENAADE